MLLKTSKQRPDNDAADVKLENRGTASLSLFALLGVVLGNQPPVIWLLGTCILGSFPPCGW